MNFRLLCAGIVLPLVAHAAPAGEAVGYDEQVLPFFKTYCLRCHDAKQQKGKFRLDTLARDFSDQTIAQRWGEVVFRLNAGEMPPKKEPQPKADEIAKAVDWIATRIKEGEAARMARRGPVTHYRLSRDEYGHTVHDLLGVYFDVNMPGAFNDDPRWHGFDRIGALLSLSPSHVERYFRAAETVLDRAFPPAAITPRKVRRVADEKTKSAGDAGPVRWLFWPSHGQYMFNVDAPGLYRIRLQLSALPSFKGRMPYLALWHHGLKRSIVGREVLAPEDKPALVEIEAFLPEGSYDIKNVAPGTFSDSHTLSNTQIVFRSTKTVQQDRRPTGYQLFSDDGQPIYPMLIVDWVEAEGPIVTATDLRNRAGVVPDKDGDLAAARASLQRFATRAWRRPATDAEMDRYVKLMHAELKAGENFRSAHRAALAGILTSKNFYYLEEGTAGVKRSRVNDWELASRLSYFLWSSMPDDDLFAACRAGMLTEPDVLRAQLKRMLASPKIKRFTDAFPRQWLQLHRVGQFPPDTDLYPDYDKWLEDSMVLESTLYFDTVFAENLPLREFLVSDWTMLNSRLALHYGMPPLQGTGFRKVKLHPEDHRGGLLTHASVLSLTSDGTRHRPVHRGVWVSEAIFGRTPPPPPPNVEPLAPSNKPKATIRMQLAAHATHATCASCHQKIDPLGFAFDNFDAIGRWRTREHVAGGAGDDPLIDAGGVLPNGQVFKGPDDFKQLLARDLDRFAEAFVEQLATFALRRVMTIDDAEQIKMIVQSSKRDEYRLRAVIENLVLSELFQKR